MVTPPTTIERREVVRSRWRLLCALNSTLDDVRQGHDSYHELATIVKDIVTNKKKDYLAQSEEEERKVSYARRLEFKHKPQNRTKTTLARYIRRTWPELRISDADLDAFCNKVMSKISSTLCFTVVNGSEIMDAYRDEVGDHSCMTGYCCQYTEIYAINPDVVSMLLYNDGSITGRALVWKTNQGDTLLDRIYPNDGRHIAAFQKYASDNGWLYRSSNGYPRGQHFGPKENVGKDWSVTLEIPDPPIYPYMDSFRRYSNKDVDWDRNTITLHTECGRHDLSSTEGEGPGSRGRYVCSSCGEHIDEDDVYHNDDGQVFCESCYNDMYSSCARCCCACLTEDAQRVGHEYWCQRCADRHAFTCHSCGDTLPLDDCCTVDGDDYCPSCAEGAVRCQRCDEMTFDSQTLDDEDYCESCYERLARQCNECGDDHHPSNMTFDGEKYLCHECEGVTHDSEDEEAVEVAAAS